MGLFKEKPASPIDKMRNHAGLYMNWIRLGAAKFQDHKELEQVFLTMGDVEMLYQQAMTGTIYDFKKKLDPALWDAVIHEYDEDMPKLKEAALAAQEALTPEEKEDLARIIAAMEAEHQEMRKMADDWFAVNGRSGCMASLLLLLALPGAAAAFGAWCIF